MILAEVDGHRRLPIVIGGVEAQAIAIELEKMTPSRPLTHDLFRSLSNAYDIDIEEVLIYNLVEGIFFAKLITTMGGRTAEIDARTSDAVAIAVRFNCPIFCEDFILEQDPGLDMIDDADGIEDHASVRGDSILVDQLVYLQNRVDEMGHSVPRVSVKTLINQGPTVTENEFNQYQRLSYT
jgi:bifunctional DNase/RNase